MTNSNILDKIGFDRAKSTDAKDKSLSVSESIIMDKVKRFGIDKVYFNKDENGNSYPAVFLKKVDCFDEETLEIISDTHREIWNYKKVLFLYVYTDLEIRIYNCSERPVFKLISELDYEQELKRIEIKSYFFSDKDHLVELNRIFSRVAIDSGIIWTLEEAAEIRKKINIKRRVDKYLVSSLVNTANALKEQGLEINFIHKIILRSLFLLYLEDRNATDKDFYSKIKGGASTFFDILEEEKSTSKLFRKLEKHFNGNVFTIEENEQISDKQLRLIRKCFISGYENDKQLKLFENWKLFDFSIIQIELLSEIYENFLFETDPKLKKKTGTYYTPPSLVEFVLNEKLPIANGEKNYNLKIIDPACGSGIFLVESFKRLVKRYENETGRKLTNFNILKELLTANIFGVELNAQAIKVAAFSLYLALVDQLNPKTIWQEKDYGLPYLINDPNDPSIKRQGKNLFCTDTIKENIEVEKLEFDLVIGNPPFGTTELSDTIKRYCQRFSFAQEMVLPFLHKATMFAPNGDIALIFNSKVLTNSGKTYQNFRRWLFNDCYVEKIYNFSILRNTKKNFGGQLFGDATGPISIIHFRNEIPLNPSEKITYYAPKSYIKTNVIEGMSIDFTDVKYLSREECRNPESKIWKIGMWGGSADWNFINSYKGDRLGDLLNALDFKFGLGLQFLDNSTKRPKVDNEISSKYIKPQAIERYVSESFVNINEGLSHKSKKIYAKYYGVDSENLPQINVFRRTGKKEAFKAPHILIKEGLSNWQVCATYMPDDCSFNSKVLGIHHKDTNLLKGIVCFLNSSFAKYFLFLTSASIGIEREEIKPNEIYNIPLILNQRELSKLAKIYDLHTDQNFLDRDKNLTILSKKVNEIIGKKLKAKKFLLSDFENYIVPLLRKDTTTITLRVDEKIICQYSLSIANRINKFLSSQEIYANPTVFNIGKESPLMMIKISFDKKKKELKKSKSSVVNELKKMDSDLWEKKSENIYFRKKVNYKSGKYLYLIRPNQKRYWSQSQANEHASDLILEILNEN